ncbi:FAD-binding oxidoreductase [Mycobacterium vicinigordonae]|uniref:FAD-binding oxidoreductase n=1 Tax=Mycobacterium vicinigordonae TaxID=1719132 RepID=A0A7D6I647_9MYCO|nr:FAD-binding protein [Mycobacterium vicinigordonae]QLL05497.1 FAD-binding oxidoreductase [Mycobacterium vicinigordonae]
MSITSSIATRLAADLPDGRVLGGADFERQRRVWNGAVDHVPAVIVRPQTAVEVADTVRVARRHELAISVRGGGHDFAGRAIRPGGLVIDLADMRGVEIRGDTARVGGGAVADDLLGAAAVHGRCAAVGSVGSVGVVGLVLGGGYGPLIGVAGMGVDNLLSARVVLGDGSIVDTDTERELELFWALRGGGGNFGVVVEIEVRLHPISEVTAGAVAFGWPQARRVLRGLADVYRDIADAFDVVFSAMRTPDGPVVFTSPVWAGPQDVAEAHIHRVRNLGVPVLDDVSRRRIADMARIASETFPAGANYWAGARIVPEINEAFIDAFIASVDSMPAQCVVIVHHAHGAATRIPVSATSFAHREPHLVVEILGMWTAGDGRTERDWLERTLRRLDDIALPGGWANLMAPDDSRARDAYRTNRSRLLEAKRRYDPEHIFDAIPLP